MSIHIPQNILVRPQSGLSGDTLHYLAKSYLSPRSYVFGDAIKSSYVMLPSQHTGRVSVFERQFCHLVHLRTHTASFIPTVIKIFTYCTVILPVLAALTCYLFKQDRRHVYNADSSIQQYQREINDHATVVALSALGMLKREDATGNTIITEAVQDKNVQLVEWLAHRTTVDQISNQINKPIIRNVIRRAISEVDQEKINKIVKILNNATEGRIQSLGLEQRHMNRLFINNRALWSYLNSRSENYYISRLPYSCHGVNPDLIYLATTPANRIAKLDEFYAIDFFLHQKKAANGDNLFMRALSNYDTEVMRWVLRTGRGFNLSGYEKSQEEIDCLLRVIRETSDPRHQEKLAQMVGLLLRERENVFALFPRDLLIHIRDRNPPLWNVIQNEYMRSRHGVPGWFHDFFSETRSGRSDHSERPSSPPPMRSSASEVTQYNTILDELYRVSGVSRTEQTANTQHAVRNLYRKACKKLHPDQVCKGDGFTQAQKEQANQVFKDFQSRCSKYDKLRPYKDLPK